MNGRARAVIDRVWPAVDAGRFAVKRCVGDVFEVFAEAFADGHDRLRLRLLHRRRGEPDWAETEMLPDEADRWRGEFLLAHLGVHEYAVAAWVDDWLGWRHDLGRREEAGDIALALRTGALLVAEAARRAAGVQAPAGAAREAQHAIEAETAAGPGVGGDAAHLAAWAARLAGTEPLGTRRAAALSDELARLMAPHPRREHEVRSEPVLSVVADPVRARFSSWYELFPRSVRGDGTHGTLADVQARLPGIAALGFDVLYLPPIHPIGRTRRKGPNNALSAGPHDPGSPWAIGAAEGGHDAVHPLLGAVGDVAALAHAARAHGIELALDIALQCSPDHPWVRERPQWFRHRPDGSVQYAENPPKRYEDIYPFDFECDDWRALWDAIESVFRFWIGQGVRVFRVDNPHTKPFAMWEHVVGRLKADHPDLVLLSEAFTRPGPMHRLAKLGFSQSYTYFTWRNTRDELAEYFTDLAQGASREYLRPNVWPATPDILPEPLQRGGRAAFVARTVLAATLAASWGVYGPAWELMEATARSPGSEEYLDSEKYQLRRWPTDRPDGLAPLLARLNAIRRDNPALQSDRGLAFLPTDNEQLVCYLKSTAALDNVVLVVVNLDARWRQSGWIELDAARLGVAPGEPFEVHDLLSGQRFRWHGARAYVELDPVRLPAHVLRVHAGRARPPGERLA